MVWSEREWEASDDFAELEDILYTGVTEGDYTEDELHRELLSLGDPQTWDNALFVIDGNQDVTLSIYDAEGARHDFTVGNVSDPGWDDSYQWVDEHDVDFDIEVDSP